MSAIQATSAGVKDMADGSLRITLEFDPRYAKEAYSLFGARGTACAVAALTLAASQQAAQQETIAEPKTKAGELCIVACNFCKDVNFWAWLHAEHNYTCFNEETAKKYILDECAISRRLELDTNNSAACHFLANIRAPYLSWKSKYAQRAA